MAKSFPVRLTLASGSPARRELLAAAGYSFEVLPANIDEPRGDGVRDIRAFVQQVAWLGRYRRLNKDYEYKVQSKRRGGDTLRNAIGS